MNIVSPWALCLGGSAPRERQAPLGLGSALASIFGAVIADTVVPHRGFPSRPRPSPHPSRLAQALEVLLLLVLFFPITALAVVVTGGERLVQSSFVHTALALIVRDLALVLVIVLFMWRRHEPFTRIGWSARGWWREAFVGVGMFAVMLVLIAVVEVVLTRAGVPGKPPLPAGLSPSGRGGDLALATALVVVVAFSEETIFRGYLLYRLGNVTRSVTVAALISSVLFALGHGYEGVLGVLVIGILGLFLAAVYLWRGTLVAVMVMHFCQDFLGLVLAPSLRLTRPI